MFCKAGLAKYSKSALRSARDKKLGLKQGAFHDFWGKAPPLSNLYLTLTKAQDVPATQFSDSTGTISQIMD